MLPANFNQLYYFWVTAKEGTVSSAKERLHLSQSTLSVQIQKLERSLGKTLFARGRHGVSLTEAGRLAFDYCDRLFGQAEEFVRTLGEDRPMRSPSLKLGIAPAVSHGIVMQVLDFVQRSGLKNRVQVFSGGWDELKGRLARHKVDIVIADADLSNDLGPDYRGRLVARLPLWFMGSPRWRSRVRKFPRDLSEAPLLLRSPEDPVRKQVEHFLYENGLSPAVAAEAESVDLIRLLLLRHEGVSALDEVSVAADLREGRLRKLHPRPLAVHQDVFFLYRRHHRGEPAFQKSIDILMDTFELRG